MVARYAHVDDETIEKVMAGIEKNAGAVDTRVEEKTAVALPKSNASRGPRVVTMTTKRARKIK